MKLGIFLIFLAVLLGGCMFQRGRDVPPALSESAQTQTAPQRTETPTVTPPKLSKPVIKETPEDPVEDTKPVDEEPSTTMPSTVDWPVLFASQAPFGVWDELHGEACEEASMIMAVKYFSKKLLTAHIMEQEILDLASWEEGNGYKIDVTANETVEILEKYFSTKAELVTEVNVERMKQELAAGNLIIIPAAGRELGNPYFQNPGPIYHMLVIRGYDSAAGVFITNDPGTKRGEGYRYKYQTLISAIHDWSHSRAEGGMTDDEMAQGRKIMIVVSK